jgi:DNA helicase HerA-like ATPase
MTDMIPLETFTPSGERSDEFVPTIRPRQIVVPQLVPIGRVLEIGGGGSTIELDGTRLREIGSDPDPSIALSGQVGGHVKLESGKRWLLANVRNLRSEGAEGGMVIAEIDFLGEGEEHEQTGRLINFKRGITSYPIPGGRVFPVSGDDMKQMFAADERAHIEIGTVYPTKDVRGALYVDALLGKHFALLGSTGTGKSTSAALIMHRICDLAPDGHIVMIDPHGEYSAAFKSNGELFNVDNLAMPYWLMNFEEHCEVFVTSSGAERQRDQDILAKCLLAARAKNRASEGLTKLTVDSPIPYALSDLASAITSEMGMLNKATDTAPFMRLKTKIDELKADPRYHFMFSGMLVADSMANFIAKIFRLPAKGKPISIIDVSGVPTDIVSVVVAVLSRLVFDYAIWSRNEVPRPVLLVCEEAHRYVPSDKTGNGQAVRKVLERIAKEGRKYGVSLGLITQRPSDLAEGVLSQCGTIIAMRLNNERDQHFVKSAMPEGARGFLDVIPALRNRECIVCGEGVSIPIRVSFDDLERDRRPASSDPLFSELWRQTGEEEAMVGRVVRRWRSQGR